MDLGTASLSSTEREPRLALTARFEWPGPSLPSIADIHSPLAALSAVFAGDTSLIETVPAGSGGPLVAVEYDGAPLIVEATEGALRSWRIDGTSGPLRIDGAHDSRITAFVVVEHEGTPLIISSGQSGELRSWRVDGTPGPLRVGTAGDEACITALAATELDAAPLIISGDVDGELRSWRIDGTPGPFRASVADEDNRAPKGRRWSSITALLVLEHTGAPLVMSTSYFGPVRTWRADGTPAPSLDPLRALTTTALVAVEHRGVPLIVSAGGGELRSAYVDGTPGPLSIHGRDAFVRRAVLAVTEHHGAPLIISADNYGLHSWRVDGRPGPLRVDPSLPSSCETLMTTFLLSLRARSGACWDVAREAERGGRSVAGASRRRAEGIDRRAGRAGP
jgi:hypothetical protein